ICSDCYVHLLRVIETRMSRASILWRIHLHLAAFSQLGVLTRIVIGRLFSGSCSGNGRWTWAPCVTGSGLMVTGDTLFHDFPANVLGSFIIGLLSTGSNLAAIYPCQCTTNNVSGLQLPSLPRNSKLQSDGELHIGLRTGYCGSLTTFSSWFMQVVILMVGRSMPPGTVRGTHWVQGMWAIYLGMSGPLFALILGQHAALAAAAFWVAAEQTSCRWQRPMWATDVPAFKPIGTLTMQSTKAKPVLEAAEVAEVAADPAPEAAGAFGSVAVSTGGNPPPPALVLEVADGKLLPANAEFAPTAATAGVGLPANTLGAAASDSASPAPIRRLTRPAKLLVDVAAGSSFLTLTGVSLAYAYLDRSTTPKNHRRYWWFSILLGPAGCFLRWHLSHLNGWRDGWLQYGTFAANMLGCVLDYVCEALMFRLAGSLTNTQQVTLQGLMVGTAGCLTTVSTYVFEIQKLALASPILAYKYFLASTVVPVALGILVYGIPAWMGT
ncbi:hypothetical protein VaNZ11_006125, partial [Volvox africanus]